MSEPAQYIPRDLTSGVTAVYFGGDDTEMQACRVWLEQFLTEEAQVACNQMGSGTMFVQDGVWTLLVPYGHYIFIDEDGIRFMAKNTFEALFKEAPTP
jgi:hypothetical protein